VLSPSHDLDVSHVAESRYYVEAATFHTSLDDAFERHLYATAAGGLRWWGTLARRVPNGSVHRYLAFGLVALIVVLVVVGMRTTWPVVSVVAISLLQVLAVVLGGPLLLGLMRKVRCRLEGRVGPPIRQPLLDLRKLARRERTRPDQASWIFSLAPLVLVGTTLMIAVMHRCWPPIRPLDGRPISSLSSTSCCSLGRPRPWRTRHRHRLWGHGSQSGP